MGYLEWGEFLGMAGGRKGQGGDCGLLVRILLGYNVVWARVGADVKGGLDMRARKRAKTVKVWAIWVNGPPAA